MIQFITFLLLKLSRFLFDSGRSRICSTIHCYPEAANFSAFHFLCFILLFIYKICTQISEHSRNFKIGYSKTVLKIEHILLPRKKSDQTTRMEKGKCKCMILKRYLDPLYHILLWKCFIENQNHFFALILIFLNDTIYYIFTIETF